MIEVDEDRLRELLTQAGVEDVEGSIEGVKVPVDPSRHLYWYRGNVVSVYDGDTCRMDWDLGANILATNEPFRWWGIQAPEIKGEQRPRGLVIRDYVRELLLDRDVIINTRKDKKGKYGRYLAEVWAQINDDESWTNMNDHLVETFDDVVPYLR